MEYLEHIGGMAAWVMISLMVLIAYGNFLKASYVRMYDLAERMLKNLVKSPILQDEQTIYVKIRLTNMTLLNVLVLSPREIVLAGIDGRKTSIILPEEAQTTIDPSGEFRISWRKK